MYMLISTCTCMYMLSCVNTCKYMYNILCMLAGYWVAFALLSCVKSRSVYQIVYKACWKGVKLCQYCCVNPPWPRLGGYPPFSDEIKEYTLQQQICQARYSFPKEYWRDVSSDGRHIYNMSNIIIQITLYSVYMYMYMYIQHTCKYIIHWTIYILYTQSS